MKKVIALFLTAVLILSSVSALGTQEMVLRFGTEAEPIGFDPHTTPQHASIRIENQLYDTLVDLDEELNVIPCLAETWEQPDDVTYIFHLRKGVQFHSGREMKAEDVKYSFERILDPNLGALGNSASYAGPIDKVEAVDDYTVKMTLKGINAPFLASMSSIYCAIVDKDVVEKNNGSLQHVDGGTGPFTLGEWVPDNSVTVHRFVPYWMEGYKLDRVEFYVISDSSARMSALRTGEVDLIVGDSAMLALAENAQNVDVYKVRTRNYVTLCLNMNKPEFKDIRVRQAISLAMNRQEIIDLAYNGEAEISGFIPASMGFWAVDVANHPLYQHDIEKAKTLMKEAGYEKGFTAVCTVGLYDTIRNSGTVIQQQLAAIGITLEIQNKENAQYVDDWKAHNFEMMVCQNGAGTDPNRGVAFFFSTKGAANIAEYSNARVDELCVLGAGTTDVEQRKVYYAEAINIILEECPNVTFASPYDYYYASAGLKNYAPNANNASEFVNVILE